MTWLKFPKQDKRTDAECWQQLLGEILHLCQAATVLSDKGRFADQPEVRERLDKAAELFHAAIDCCEEAQARMKQ